MTSNRTSTAPEMMVRRFEGFRPRRVVIVRALPGLGDFLCAVPAWRALRAALPNAHITLLGLARTRPLARRYAHYFDDFLEFGGFPGIMEQPPHVEQLPAFLKEVHGRRFDLALQMHGSGVVSNLYTLLLGARRSAGFYLPSNYCPDEETFFPYPEHLPEVRRNLALLRELGIPAQGEQLEFSLHEADHADFALLSRRYGLVPGNYVCLHPGAHDVARRWPPSRFATVGAALQQQGLQVVLTGSSDESGVTAAVAARLPQPALDLAGKTSLGALALLLRHARLLLSNDTGISHLAAAMQTPSVVVFIASSPARWAPLDRARHRAVGSDDGLFPPTGLVLHTVEAVAATKEAATYV